MCEETILESDKFHALIRTHYPQYGSHRNRESPPLRITLDPRYGKLIFLPASSEFAPDCREHVLHHSDWLLYVSAMMNPLGARNTFTEVR